METKRIAVAVMDGDTDYLWNYAELPTVFDVAILKSNDRNLPNDRNFDVLILDPTQLRVLGLKEFRAGIRSIGWREEKTVLHGYFSVDEMCRYLDFGFKEVLPKPADMEILSAKIRNIAMNRTRVCYRKPVVLIVDDDSYERERLCYLLHGSYEIYEADNLENAKRTAIENCPDVVLLDIAIGNESGLHFLKWAREQSRRLQVICISGKNITRIKREAFGLGALDYLVKPYPSSILTRKLQNAVSN